jgi:hypothetical protein
MIVKYHGKMVGTVTGAASWQCPDMHEILSLRIPPAHLNILVGWPGLRSD